MTMTTCPGLTPPGPAERRRVGRWVRRLDRAERLRSPLLAALAGRPLTPAQLATAIAVADGQPRPVPLPSAAGAELVRRARRDAESPLRPVGARSDAVLLLLRLAADLAGDAPPESRYAFELAASGHRLTVAADTRRGPFARAARLLASRRFATAHRVLRKRPDAADLAAAAQDIAQQLRDESL